MRCDTCGRDVPEVKRVVIAPGYDRTLAKAIYNCPECYEKKEKAKKYNTPETQVPPFPAERAGQDKK